MAQNNLAHTKFQQVFEKEDENLKKIKTISACMNNYFSWATEALVGQEMKRRDQSEILTRAVEMLKNDLSDKQEDLARMEKHQKEKDALVQETQRDLNKIKGDLSLYLNSYTYF